MLWRRRSRTGNQDLKVAEARFRQARAVIRVNRAAQFPTITTQPGVSALRDSDHRPFFPANQSATGDFVLPFDLSYEVDLWGRVRKTVNAAREEAQAVAADRETARLSLEAELAMDYFELRSADAQKRILDDTVKALYAAALAAHARESVPKGGDNPLRSRMSLRRKRSSIRRAFRTPTPMWNGRNWSTRSPSSSERRPPFSACPRRR